MAPKKLPTFDELPLDKNGPPGNAWGLWGSDDQLGRLNLLTPETVRAAASEIREGIRISLDWPLDKLSHPPFGRQALEHRILNKAPMTMNDDVITLNTQSSTQWDGFRHYGEYRRLLIMSVLTVGQGTKGLDNSTWVTNRRNLCQDHNILGSMVSPRTSINGRFCLTISSQLMPTTAASSAVVFS